MNEIPLQEIYNIENRNYHWQTIKYPIPKQYYPYQKLITNKQLKRNVTNLKFLNYEQIEKSKIPASNQYHNQLNYRPISGKINKENRKTNAEEIIFKLQKQNMPGPASYFQRPKTALKISQKNNNNKKLPFKEHYLNEVEYLAISSPGVGSYNLNNCKLKSTKLIKKSILKQKSQKIINCNLNPILINSFQWISKQKKCKNSNFFGKKQRFQEYNKHHEKPGPNSYTINNNWKDDRNNLNTIVSSTKNKNIYYN